MEQDGLAQLARVVEAGFNTLADLQRETNARLDQTNARLDQTNARLDQTNARLDDLRADVDRLREETAAGLQRHEEALVKLVRHSEALAERFDSFLLGAHHQAHEDLRREHDSLEARVASLERKVA